MANNTNGEVEKVNVPYNWNLSEKEDEEACAFALSFVSSDMKVPVLEAVNDLGILHMISQCGPGGRMSATEIASRLPTSNPEAVAMLGRLLDFLVSYSVLTVATNTLPGGAVERRYGLGKVCKFFLPNEDGVSLVPFANGVTFKTMINSSLHLKDAILEGGSIITMGNGMPLYEYASKHLEHQERFHKSMSHHSTLVMRKILKTYKGFEGVSTLVDVGGGSGATLSMIISQYPTIKGINFDLPSVIVKAPPYPGIEHIGGDIFNGELPKGDAIFLKWICHCFNDETCIKILKNCYNALPQDHGKVVICEYLRPETSETSGNIISNSVIHFDMIMMVVPDGKERTKEEFEKLALAAGFQGFQVVCSGYNVHIMELFKQN